MGITQQRVHHVRESGVEVVDFVQDWMGGITGDFKADWPAVSNAHV